MPVLFYFFAQDDDSGTLNPAPALKPAMAMKAAEKTRLKVLGTVTVSQLEQAVKTGFRHLGHTSLERLFVNLDSMSWKTSMSSHLVEVAAMEPLLTELLCVCSNGMLPNALLLKALRSIHAEQRFEMKRPQVAPANWEDSCLSYLVLRLRQITGKLREMASSLTLWKQVTKKATSFQERALAKLCKIINPRFDGNGQGSETLALQYGGQGTETFPLQLGGDEPTAEDTLIEETFRKLRANVAGAAQEPSSSSQGPALDPQPQGLGFMEVARQRALQAALEGSPAKPLTKRQRAEAEETAEAEEPPKPPKVLKKPSFRRPAAALEPDKTSDPDIERYGCAKCRSLRFGCGQCKKWAETGHRNYFFTDKREVAQKKQG